MKAMAEPRIVAASTQRGDFGNGDPMRFAIIAAFQWFR
jgi:hypothetical protein